MRRLGGFFTLLFLLSSDCRPVLAEDPVHHTFRYLSSSGSPQTYQTMTFSPDSSQLAISVGGKVCFIDLKAGRETGEYDSSPFGIAYSKNGERIHLIGTNQISLIDTLTGDNIRFDVDVKPGYLGLSLEKQSGKLLISRISPGGPVAAINEIAVGDELLGLGEGQSGELSDMTGRDVAVAIGRMQGPAGTYVRLRLLPRGRFSDTNAKTYVVRRQEGRKRGTEVDFITPSRVEIDDNLVWCFSDGRHAFCSAFTAQPIAFLQTSDVENVGLYAVSPDQRKFAVVARLRSDRSHSAVEVFDIATQDRLSFTPHTKDSFYDIAFAPDNNRVLVATWDSLEVVDVAKQQACGRLDLGWKPPSPKPEKRQSGASTASVVRAAADIARIRPSDDVRSPIQLVAQVAVSSNEIVATGDASGHVKLWDLNSGLLLQELPENPQAKVVDVTFSPDGKWLAYLVAGILNVVDVSGVERPGPEQLARHQVQQSPSDSDASKDAKEFEPMVGGKVEVHSRGQWYPAVITGVESPGQWQIHYDDSPDAWNEMVTRSRLRPRSEH